MTDARPDHAALMDSVYRRQRLFYDATRKYYLLGRDHLVEKIEPTADARILEVACGTGRNLDRIDKRYPGRRLYGFDISQQMLISARAKLGHRATLAPGDACDYDPLQMFGAPQFDHIIMSYSLSMIPDWRAAIDESLRHLAPGGRLHIVDFGDQSGLPNWFDRALRQWLAKFHVKPRDALRHFTAQLSGCSVQHEDLYGTYAQYLCLRLPNVLPCRETFAQREKGRDGYKELTLASESV